MCESLQQYQWSKWAHLPSCDLPFSELQTSVQPCYLLPSHQLLPPIQATNSSWVSSLPFSFYLFISSIKFLMSALRTCNFDHFRSCLAHNWPCSTTFELNLMPNFNCNAITCPSFWLPFLEWRNVTLTECNRELLMWRCKASPWIHAFYSVHGDGTHKRASPSRFFCFKNH